MGNIEKILFKENSSWKEYKSLSLDSSTFEGSKRGISFISLEGYKKLINDNDKGFCHKRFKANFIIKDININTLQLGQRLNLGYAIIKVTKVGKECFSNCPIIESTRTSCNVNKEAFFGEIVEEGLVNKNDKITIIA